MTYIDIDGSILEGGGQVVRISASLSALMQKPIRIHSIRAGRPKPGLAAQHMAGLHLVAAMCSGELHGAEIGSTEVSHMPRGIFGKAEYDAVTVALTDAKTAGATTLLFQSSLPICSLRIREACQPTTTLKLKGGTNVPFSPQVEYIQHVLAPNLHRLIGLQADIHLERRGLFPKGGGVLKAVVHTRDFIPGFNVLERGKVTAVGGVAWACGAASAQKVGEMSEAITQVLKNNEALRGAEVKLHNSAEGKAGGCEGFGAVLWADTESGLRIGGSALYSKGMSASQCGTAAAEELVCEVAHGGCVDTYTQDQIIVFMSLAKEGSEIKCGPLTQHTKTAIHFAQVLTGATFTVTEEPDYVILKCTGRPVDDAK